MARVRLNQIVECSIQGDDTIFKVISNNFEKLWLLINHLNCTLKTIKQYQKFYMALCVGTDHTTQHIFNSYKIKISLRQLYSRIERIKNR